MTRVLHYRIGGNLTPLTAGNGRMDGARLSHTSPVLIKIAAPTGAQSGVNGDTQVFRLNRAPYRLFRLDPRGGKEIELDPKALGVLDLLVRHVGETVTKERIARELWGGKIVEDGAIHVQVTSVRRALGQQRLEPGRKKMQPSCIQTVSREGWKLLATVTPAEGPEVVQPAARPGDDVPAVPSSAPLRPRLSIVVLPFANLSEDRGQQYFADGITDDVTTDLSRIDGMFVIPRNTAFTDQNKPVDTRQIGRELGVRYLLEGSVRRSGNQVRVNVQLVDADADAHLWADRFDCETADLFSLQNEITSRIAVALNLELVIVEATQPTNGIEALDYIFRGRAAAYGKLPSDETYSEAIALFERALALDPHSVEAQGWLASVLANRALDFPSDMSRADIARSEELAAKAVAASPRRPLPHFAEGQALRVQFRCEEAIAEYEKVLALNRNWVGAIFAIGWCRFHIGFIDEMLPALEKVMRLSPRDPYMGLWYARIGIVHLLQSRIDDAIIWFEKARSAVPNRAYTRANLAAAYALKGEIGRAADELAEARRLSRNDRYLSIERLKTGNFGVPKVRALFETTYFAGLRMAGLPEE